MVSGHGGRHRVPEGDERVAHVQDRPVGPRLSETRPQRRRLPLVEGSLRMLAAPAAVGASGGASCAVSRGSIGALAPSESSVGQVSTSLPLAPPPRRSAPPGNWRGRPFVVADVGEGGAEVISITGVRCRVAEVRGIAGMWWADSTMWQAVAGGCHRLLSAVTAISCVSWRGNQPSGLLTGEEPCRSMNG